MWKAILDFYKKYRPYIQVDALMYLFLILFLLVLILFFG